MDDGWQGMGNGWQIDNGDGWKVWLMLGRTGKGCQKSSVSASILWVDCD